MSKPRRLWQLLAIVAATATLLAGTATAAQATTTFCGGTPLNRSCTITLQGYASGGVTRSQMQGSFGGFHSGAYDIIDGQISVRDVSSDGWRARAWVNIYQDCYCVSSANRVRAWNFDATTNAWATHYWSEFGNPAGAGTDYYTVQVIIGRYYSPTGACEPTCGTYHASEQRFYFTLD